MAGWRSTGWRSAWWLACGGLTACGGPGLEPPLHGDPAAEAGGATATGGASATGGTAAPTGGNTTGSGGEAAFTGGAATATGGSSQPPPVVSGGASSTGGSVVDWSGSDGGMGMSPGCVEFAPAEVPCVFELPPDTMGTVSASDVRVTLGPADAASTVEEVTDASACGPQGYYLPAGTTALQVVLCPASCAASAALSVRVEVGCGESSTPAMDAGR